MPAWALARTMTRLHQRVAGRAITDPLTGLSTRRYVAQTLDHEVSRGPRGGKNQIRVAAATHQAAKD
ncbi:MAG: hypothetical protein ACM33U_05335 [Solirubrobacterales bacterium]